MKRTDNNRLYKAEPQCLEVGIHDEEQHVVSLSFDDGER